MEKYYGNYLGLCINNDDPEKRGRTQVFIPHIMPALYENWNEASEDIKLICVGNNLPDSLPDAVLEKLKLTLPWAESASPIMGTSAPGNLVGSPSYSQTPGNNSYNQSPVPDAPGYAGEVGTGQLGSAGPLNIPSINPNLDTAGLNGTFKQRLNGFYDEAKSLGYNVAITSGYRSIEKQRQLYNASAKDGSVAPPGSSAHNFGIAADIRVTGNGVNITSFKGSTDRTQNQDTPAFRSLLAKYGLHQPLHPSVKTSGISEKWHIEPIETASGGRGAAGFGAIANSLAGTGSGSSVAGSGYETPSTSGQLAAASPHQSEAPIGNSTSDPSSYGSVANPKVDGAAGVAAGTVQSNADGSVNQAALRNYLKQRIANSKLNGYKPADGAKYGVDGSVDSWVNHFMSVAKHESSYYNSSTNRADKGGSIGLFQVSTLDGSRYKANPTGQDWTEAQLRDPAINASTAVSIYERNVLRDGQIVGEGGKGAGGYYAALTMGKVANETANGTIGSFDPNAPTSPAAEIASSSPPGQLVQNKDPHGTAAVMDLNNMAAGMFSYPAAGALLWCFFREGNPLYPVYFAASYSQNEWQSAYRYNVASPAQDGVGYKPSAGPDSPTTSVGGAWNIGKVGAIAWTDETNPNDPKTNQKSLMITGHDGSNIFFNEGYHQFFSKFDRRDQVEGDRWETTLGQKEEWVQGDSNLVVMGDMFIKIGNVGPEAVQAVEKIQSIIKESMQPLTECRDCSQGSGSSGSKSSFTKETEKNSPVKSPSSNAFNIPVGSPLSMTNSVTPVNIPSTAQGTPVPSSSPSSPQNINATRININPAAASTAVASNQAPSKPTFTVVKGSGFPSGNLKVNPI